MQIDVYVLKKIEIEKKVRNFRAENAEILPLH